MTPQQAETVRTQAEVARAQAVATVVTLDALLATLPPVPKGTTEGRRPMAYLGDNEES